MDRSYLGQVWVMGLHWDVTDGKNIDLDASVLVMDEKCAVLDVVFFNKLMSRDRAVVHCGDEREGDEVGDDEKSESVMIDCSMIKGETLENGCLLCSS